MSKSVTIYNGTFRKLNGQTRTMRFIRKSDLPSSMVNESTIADLEGKTGNEVVYDVDKRSFRQFNWKTTEGQVTETSTTYNFQWVRFLSRGFPIDKKAPSFGQLFPEVKDWLAVLGSFRVKNFSLFLNRKHDQNSAYLSLRRQ